MEEEWKQIPEFPMYAVSNFGRVMNLGNDRILSTSYVQGGTTRVTFIHQGHRYTRSVNVLVAEAFIPQEDPSYDTPILLDGQTWNVRADNIVWRPRAYAWRYKHQFKNIPDIHAFGPLQDRDSLVMYRDVFDAATTCGLLFTDIWRCINGVIPNIPITGQRIFSVHSMNQIVKQRQEFDGQ